MIVRFFRSDAMSEHLGEVDDAIIEFPGEFVQLTYQHARNFDGEIIAKFLGKGWLLVKTNTLYSDIVIAGDDSPIAEDAALLLRDWKYEVTNGDTVLGFSEWKAHQAEAASK